MYKIYAIGFVLLAGCAQKDVHKKRDVRTDLANKVEKKLLNSFSVKEKWWTDFNDSYLNKSIEDAFEIAPSIQDAKASIEKANAAYTRISGDSLPSSSLNASYMKNKQSYNMGLPDVAVIKGLNDYPKATIDSSYYFDLWNKNKNEIESMLSTLEATQLSYEQAKLLLAMEIVSVYVTLDQLYKMLDVIETAVSIRETTKQLFEKRFKEGIENESSYEQAKASYHLAVTERESILEQIQLTAQKFSILIGKTPEYAEKIKPPHLNSVDLIKDIKNISSDLIGRRLDILIQKARLQSFSKNIDAAEADYYPKINLVASVGKQSLGVSDFFKKGSTIASFGPSLSLPIFNKRNLDAQYADAISDYNRTVAQYESAILNALNEVSANLITRKAIMKKIEEMELALEASQKAYDIARDRYCGGLSTYIEVLRSEDALISVKRTVTDLYKQAALLQIQLIQSLGGGYNDH